MGAKVKKLEDAERAAEIQGLRDQLAACEKKGKAKK